jgi:hypothetical protein
LEGGDRLLKILSRFKNSTSLRVSTKMIEEMERGVLSGLWGINIKGTSRMMRGMGGEGWSG